MSVMGRAPKAFKRSSSALCLVIGLMFFTMVLSTAYNTLRYESSVFLKKENVDNVEVYQRSELRWYENELEKVGRMEEPERTQYYYLSNSEVVGVYLVGTPSYFSFYSLLYNGHSLAIAFSYWYHLGEEGKVSVPTESGDVKRITGKDSLLGFTASSFLHGVFELTGIFIIAAISLRAAWALWRSLGHMLGAARREGRLWSLRPSKGDKREIRRHKGETREFLIDFALMVAVGTSLVFLAAPLEAYVSPKASIFFLQAPVLALVFLAGVALFYFSICVFGFKALRRDARAIYEDLKLFMKRKWLPAHFSFLMFLICSLIMLVKYLT